ncbi:MAG TPA: AMP-binding protein, partial [Alphaproteobacteria bacterium]
MDTPVPTARDRIYSDDWRAWRDPAVPDAFNPTTYLLDQHAALAKPALYVDDASYSYGDLLGASCRAAHALTALGLEPENRVLFFGTDSLDYIALWLGAV